MYIPIIKKVVKTNNVLIERSLPKEGKIYVEPGNNVEPSDKIGSCKVSYEAVDLGENFKPYKVFATGQLALAETAVGRQGSKKFVSPFNGYLRRNNGNYFFMAQEKDYWLLPGVWGEVVKVKRGYSVLLKTQMTDMHIPVATKSFTAGELIVFPNPSQLLEAQFLNKYLKSAAGKIIYAGHSITLNFITEAHRLNVPGILAGSASRDVLTYANKNKIAIGLFTGFGQIPTPNFIYNMLNDIAHRYVFLDGARNVLRIPATVPFSAKELSDSIPKSILQYVKKDLQVQIFKSPYFGYTGKVDKVSKSSIFVKVSAEAEPFEVSPPNVFAIE